MKDSKDNKEYRDKMLYRGFMIGSDAPETGYATTSSHYRVNDDLRKKQLNDIGLSGEDELVDPASEEGYVDIKKQRRKRLAILFAAMFALSLVIALVVCWFLGGYYEPLGGLGIWGIFAITAAVSGVLFLVPTIIMLVMK